MGQTKEHCPQEIQGVSASNFPEAVCDFPPVAF